MEMETTIIFNWAQLMKNQRKISKDQDQRRSNRNP